MSTFNKSVLKTLSRYYRELNKIDDSVKCIHGHFPAKKYLPFFVTRNIRFITWVRDPFDRMLSNYFYWKSLDIESVSTD